MNLYDRMKNTVKKINESATDITRRSGFLFEVQPYVYTKQPGYKSGKSEVGKVTFRYAFEMHFSHGSLVSVDIVPEDRATGEINIDMNNGDAEGRKVSVPVGLIKIEKSSKKGSFGPVDAELSINEDGKVTELVINVSTMALPK